MAESILHTDISDALSFNARNALNQARRDLDGFMETCSISSFGEALSLSPEAGVAIGSRLLSLLAIERGQERINIEVKEELFNWARYNNDNVLDLLGKTELANMAPENFSTQNQLLTNIANALFEGILHARQTPIVTHQRATRYVALNDAKIIAQNYHFNMPFYKVL